MSIMAGFYTSADGTSEADIMLRAKGDLKFQVVEQFVYIDRQGVVWPVPPNSGTSTTDLASVPAWLWGLVSSYGRQLAPALMHDHYCAVARAAKKEAKGDEQKRREAYKSRKATDLRFREALRVKEIAWLRSNVFWGAVTLGRYKTFKPWLAVLFAVQAIATATGVLGAISVWAWHWLRRPSEPNGPIQAAAATPAKHADTALVAHPWFWLLIAGAAVLLSVVYGWNSMLAVASGCLAAPLVLVELAITLAMSLCLAIPDWVILVFGCAFTGGKANLHPPHLVPWKLR